MGGGASGGFCGVRRVRALQRRRPSPAICSRRLASRRCRTASRLVVASASAKAFVESSCEYRCQAWVMACSVSAISLRSFVKILSICIVLLLDPLENLIQWRFLAFGRGVSRLALASACVTTLRVVLIGDCHDIPHIHMPDTITELAHLADIHPVPAIPHRDFIVRADFDAFATLLQDHIFS